MKCQNITHVVIPGDGSQASLCPPNRPIWNADLKACSQCESDTPYWSEELGKCLQCPHGYAWNSTSGKCQSQTTTVTCQ